MRARRVGQVDVDSGSYLIIDSERLRNRSFDSVQLDKFTAINSRFRDCSFVNARIRDACWGGGRKRTDYIGCTFDGARFGSVSPGNARFVDCSFERVQISEFLAHDVELINCRFSGVIDKGFLNGRRERSNVGWFERRRNRIVRADFSECELRDFAFRTGIRLQQERLPSGARYVFIDDLRASLEGAKAHVAAWDSAEDRRLGEALIRSMEIDLDDGQHQQLYIVTDSGQFAAVSRALAAYFVAS